MTWRVSRLTWLQQALKLIMQEASFCPHNLKINSNAWAHFSPGGPSLQHAASPVHQRHGKTYPASPVAEEADGDGALCTAHVADLSRE